MIYLEKLLARCVVLRAFPYICSYNQNRWLWSLPHPRIFLHILLLRSVDICARMYYDETLYGF